MTADDVRSLRLLIGLDQPDFARLVGVNVRTVVRWEAGGAKPSGSAEAVLNAIRAKLDKDPDMAPAVIAVLVRAASVGRLAPLLMELLDGIK